MAIMDPKAKSTSNLFSVLKCPRTAKWRPCAVSVRDGQTKESTEGVR